MDTRVEEIQSFLKNKVIGKTLCTAELTYQLEEGKLEGVYSDKILFSNLTTNAWGFNFDMFIISNEKIYNLEDGKRTTLYTNFDGVSVFRFELAKRNSTGEITGLFRLITTSATNQTAQGVVSGIYNVKLAENRLSWSEEQSLYRDQPNGKNTFSSIAFTAESCFYFEQDKLVFNYKGTCFDVSPTTLSRTLSKSVFPSFIAKEI